MSNRFWQKPRRITAGIVAGAIASMAALAASPAGAITTNYGIVNKDGDQAFRLWGASRYDTSVQIAQSMFDGPSCFGSTVTVASGDNFPDALAASPLRTPIILVPKSGALPASVSGFLATCNAVNIVGGPAAVGTDVETAIKGLNGSLAVNTRRWAGVDRFTTAATIAVNALGVTGTATDLTGATTTHLPTVIIARADQYADALSASPLAAWGADGTPHAILLTNTGSLPSATVQALFSLGAKQAIVMGQAAAVSDAVLTQLKGIGVQPVRVGGIDRFATAVAFNTTVKTLGFTGPSNTVKYPSIARFDDFADALAAGPYLGSRNYGCDAFDPINPCGSPVYLGVVYGVTSSVAPATTIVGLTGIASFNGNNPATVGGNPGTQTMSIFGGPSAISDPTALAAATALQATGVTGSEPKALSAVAKVTAATAASTLFTDGTNGGTLSIKATSVGAIGNAWTAQLVTGVGGLGTGISVTVSSTTRTVSVAFGSSYAPTSGSTLAGVLNANPTFSSIFSAAGGSATFNPTLASSSSQALTGGYSSIAVTVTFDKTLTATGDATALTVKPTTTSPAWNADTSSISGATATFVHVTQIPSEFPVLGSLVTVGTTAVVPNLATPGVLLIASVS